MKVAKIVIMSLLAVVIILAGVVVPVLGFDGEESELKFAFITDCHVVANSVFTADNYGSYATKDKMVHLTDAILNTVADDIIAKGQKFVFVGGDISESGDEASHKAAAKTFARLEKAGVNVFVINGNHDIAQTESAMATKVSAEEFRTIYKEFGYSEALSEDTRSLSYTAKLNDKYRLLAIDNMSHLGFNGEQKAAIDSEEMTYITEEVKKAKADNVTLVTIAHSSFLTHMPQLVGLTYNKTTQASFDKIMKLFQANGVECLFAGHYHMQDIISDTDADGNVFVDVDTASLSYFPCAYREVNYTDRNIRIDTDYVESINSSYLSSFSPLSERESLNKGLQAYCRWHLNREISEVIANVGKPHGILDNLNLGEELQLLKPILLEVADKTVNMPFYIKDETDGNISYERIFGEYGVTLPAVPFKNVAELAPYLVSVMMGGDEDIPHAPEIEMVKYALCTALYNFGQSAEDIAYAYPSLPRLNFDNTKLLKQGIMECYDSNFIKFVLAIIGDNEYSNVINNVIGQNFDTINQLNPFVKLLSKGLLDGITEHFKHKDWYVNEMVDAVFDKYAHDYVVDIAPSDNFVVIKRG